jgi:hypothetical protein
MRDHHRLSISHLCLLDPYLYVIMWKYSTPHLATHQLSRTFGRGTSKRRVEKGLERGTATICIKPLSVGQSGGFGRGAKFGAV